MMLVLTLYLETTGSFSRHDGTAASLKQLVFLAAAIFAHYFYPENAAQG